jgi:hypothetical protein
MLSSSDWPTRSWSHHVSLSLSLSSCVTSSSTAPQSIKMIFFQKNKESICCGIGLRERELKGVGIHLAPQPVSPRTP